MKANNKYISRSSVFIVKFEHILHVFLMFLLLTSKKWILGGSSYSSVSSWESRDIFGSVIPSDIHESLFYGVTRPAITCSKLTTETLEQGVKYVQSC